MEFFKGFLSVPVNYINDLINLINSLNAYDWGVIVFLLLFPIGIAFLLKCIADIFYS